MQIVTVLVPSALAATPLHLAQVLQGRQPWARPTHSATATNTAAAAFLAMVAEMSPENCCNGVGRRRRHLGQSEVTLINSPQAGTARQVTLAGWLGFGAATHGRTRGALDVVHN